MKELEFYRGWWENPDSEQVVDRPLVRGAKVSRGLRSPEISDIVAGFARWDTEYVRPWVAMQILVKVEGKEGEKVGEEKRWGARRRKGGEGQQRETGGESFPANACSHSRVLRRLIQMKPASDQWAQDTQPTGAHIPVKRRGRLQEVRWWEGQHGQPLLRDTVDSILFTTHWGCETLIGLKFFLLSTFFVPISKTKDSGIDKTPYGNI